MSNNLTTYLDNDFKNANQSIPATKNVNNQSQTVISYIFTGLKLDAGLVCTLYNQNASAVYRGGTDGISVNSVANEFGAYGVSTSPGTGTSLQGWLPVATNAYIVNYQEKRDTVFNPPSDPMTQDYRLSNGFSFRVTYKQTSQNDPARSPRYYYYQAINIQIIVTGFSLWKDCTYAKFANDGDCSSFYPGYCNGSIDAMTTVNCQTFCSNSPDLCQGGYVAYCSVRDNVVNPFCLSWCNNNKYKPSCDPLMIDYCQRHQNDTSICGCLNVQSYNGISKLMGYYNQPYLTHCNVLACSTNASAYKTNEMVTTKCSDVAICIQNLNLSAADIKLGNVSQKCSIGITNTNPSPGGSSGDASTIIQQYIMQYGPYAIGIFSVIVILLLFAIFRPVRRSK